MILVNGPEKGEAAPEQTGKKPEILPQVPPQPPEKMGQEAREKAAKMVGGAQENVEELKAGELPRNLDDDKAAEIYDTMIDPAKITIDDFTNKEKDYDKNKKGLEAAFVAAGGNPERLKMAGEKVRPSNVLFDGTEDKNDLAYLNYIYGQLNAVDPENHINGLKKLSRGPDWKKFSEALVTLNDRKNKAKEAFEKTQKA